jgi:hypothetical protein
MAVICRPAPSARQYLRIFYDFLSIGRSEGRTALGRADRWNAREFPLETNASPELDNPGRAGHGRKNRDCDPECGPRQNSGGPEGPEEQCYEHYSSHHASPECLSPFVGEVLVQHTFQSNGMDVGRGKGDWGSHGVGARRLCEGTPAGDKKGVKSPLEVRAQCVGISSCDPS